MASAQLEIIAGAFEAATREMVASLIRTAYSPNIKERGDCSTALCDIEGRALSLTTNAPAHLGSTLRLVPQILKRFPAEALEPGDAFLANDRRDPLERLHARSPDFSRSEACRFRGLGRASLRRGRPGARLGGR